MSHETRPMPRAYGVSCPASGDTLPPSFCVCGEAGHYGSFWVYLVMVDQNGNSYCCSYEITDGASWCRLFNVPNMREGDYNLYVYTVDNNNGVNCDNIAGKATSVSFIPGITIKNGVSDPNAEKCRREHGGNYQDRVAVLERIVGQLTVELMQLQKKCDCQ